MYAQQQYRQPLDIPAYGRTPYGNCATPPAAQFTTMELGSPVLERERVPTGGGYAMSVSGAAIVKMNEQPPTSIPIGRAAHRHGPNQASRVPAAVGWFRGGFSSALFDRDSALMIGVREFVATYVYVFVVFASSAALVADFFPLAVARGLIAGVACFVFGGAYANPIFSLAGVCSRKIRVGTFFVHLIAQFVAMILAATTVQYGLDLDLGHAVPHGGSDSSCFVAEFIGTFVLCVLVAATCEEDHWRMRALFVGLTYAPVVIAVWPVSGACFDPFLAIGASLFSHFHHDAWIYCAAPIAAALLASLVVAVAHLRDIHQNGAVLTPVRK